MGSGKKKDSKGTAKAAAPKAAAAKEKKSAKAETAKEAKGAAREPKTAKAGKGASGKTDVGALSASLARVSKKGSARNGSGASASRSSRAGYDASSAEAVCREVACDGLATTGVYCRLHYIKNWRKIKRKEIILQEGKLNQYIEELVLKYPDKYIEAIRLDLTDDKNFSKVIYDLDLDESVDEFETESESSENLIDNIKRDFEDEGESY